VEAELADHAKRVIDANRDMRLGTADESGHPWVVPVCFASQDHVSFHWISSPLTERSRNLLVRPEGRHRGL
jgi:nitroimidazol reductase NimA-like FMN-containing flavoprotein (pyridoxamine 5'-phosphate oxidase superfamily)